MDVDYLAKTNNNSSSRRPQQRQLCAYDKQEMESLPEPEEQLTSSFSVDISHFATYLCKLPRSTVYINHKPTSILWDTGGDINGIQYELLTTMNY
ncbi:hypothetical protein G6F62_012398 [Rhizopus arrhizus]|nr:hypothetical protein G6F62_012398 [Rhizopus arrhizus]